MQMWKQLNICRCELEIENTNKYVEKIIRTKHSWAICCIITMNHIENIPPHYYALQHLQWICSSFEALPTSVHNLRSKDIWYLASLWPVDPFLNIIPIFLNQHSNLGPFSYSYSPCIIPSLIGTYLL